MLITTVIINTALFYFIEKVELESLLKGFEVFFSCFILIALWIGIMRNRTEKNVNSNLTLFLLGNGIIIFSVYLFKILKHDFLLNLTHILTSLIGVISIILLLKIHFDLLKKKLPM